MERTFEQIRPGDKLYSWDYNEESLVEYEVLRKTNDRLVVQDSKERPGELKIITPTHYKFYDSLKESIQDAMGDISLKLGRYRAQVKAKEEMLKLCEIKLSDLEKKVTE